MYNKSLGEILNLISGFLAGDSLAAGIQDNQRLPGSLTTSARAARSARYVTDIILERREE